MNLSAYFKRIGFNRPARVSLQTLNALMEAHIRAIPFENLDVYAERGASNDKAAIFDTIVTRGRGGWCYEMNALFGWALREIGFEVQRLSAGVRRESLGDAALGNHLCLMVTLNRPYLVDVGFGSSQLFALPLEEGVTTHRPLQIALAKIDGGFWRLHEGGIGAATSYDFMPGWCDEERLAASHKMQVSDPESIFRKTLVAKIRRGEEYITLRGRALQVQKPGWKETTYLDTPERLAEVLQEIFELVEPDIERLWPAICDRHLQLFPHTEGGRLA